MSDTTVDTPASKQEPEVIAPEAKIESEDEEDLDLIVIVNDGEFSGPDILTNFMVSWGSQAYSLRTGALLGENLVHYINPYASIFFPDWNEETKNWLDPVMGWDDTCKNEFWLKDPKGPLAKEFARANRGEGLGVVGGTIDKVKWFRYIFETYGGSNPNRMFFMSDTASSDNTFMNYYISRAKKPSLHTHFGIFRDVICTSSLDLGLLRNRHGLPLKIAKASHFSENQMVREYFDIPEEDQPVTEADHNPLHDCANIMEQFLIHAAYAYERERHYISLSVDQIPFCEATKLINSIQEKVATLLDGGVYSIGGVEYHNTSGALFSRVIFPACVYRGLKIMDGRKNRDLPLHLAVAPTRNSFLREIKTHACLIPPEERLAHPIFGVFFLMEMKGLKNIDHLTWAVFCQIYQSDSMIPLYPRDLLSFAFSPLKLNVCRIGPHLESIPTRTLGTLPSTSESSQDQPTEKGSE